MLYVYYSFIWVCVGLLLIILVGALMSGVNSVVSSLMGSSAGCRGENYKQ